MKRPVLISKAKTVNSRKSVGRPPDTSRGDSSGTSSSDPSFFSSLELLHALGIEQYRTQESSSIIPFPDLCKKMDQWNFAPGVLKDNIYAVKQILNATNFCSVSVDVLPIQPVIQFDSMSEIFTGFVAPLSSEMKLANEIVVFFIQGFEVEWKCLAGYMLVNLQDDGWAIWHVLNQMIVLLAQYDFTVINVVFGSKCGFEILDNYADENVIKGDSIVQHPYYKGNILCFAKSVDDLIRLIGECIVQNKFDLPDEILEKYELNVNMLRQDHIQLLIGCDYLSTESVTTWLFQKNREFPEEDKMPEMKTEIFILRMLWMWVNAMTFVLDDDTSGFYSVETHVQTLKDTACIFEVMEKNVQSYELLWNNMRRSTLSALSLYDHYVAKGLVNGIKFNSFRCVSVNHLRSFVANGDLTSEKPKPCSMLQFLRLINSALIVHSNFCVSDFESGQFLIDYLKHRRLYLSPVDIEEQEDLSDLCGLGLYYLSGRIVTKLMNRNECDKCKTAVVADVVNPNIPREWTDAVDNRELLHPSMSVYDTLQWAESLFVHTDEDIFRFHKPCTQFAYRIYGELSFGIRSTFPPCHDILRNLLAAFMEIRLKMVANDLSGRLK